MAGGGAARAAPLGRRLTGASYSLGHLGPGHSSKLDLDKLNIQHIEGSSVSPSRITQNFHASVLTCPWMWICHTKSTVFVFAFPSLQLHFSVMVTWWLLRQDESLGGRDWPKNTNLEGKR